MDVATKPQDITAENILQRLSDLTTHPHEEIVPYRKFNVDGKLYYFPPGRVPLPQGPGNGSIGGFFCGYLTDEVWHYRAYQG